MSGNSVLNEMETLFLALADKTRLRLLNLMRGGEVCVYLFTEILGESQPKISRHLAYLRNAGVVEARREGKLIYYRILTPDDKSELLILNNVLNWLENQKQMQTEYNKLNAAGSDKTNFSKQSLKAEDHFPKANTSANPHTTHEKDELEIFLL